MSPERKVLSEELRRMLSLPGNPVGIKLLKAPRELLDVPNVRSLGSTAPCQMAAIARYGREDSVVGASTQATKCVWGASCFGLIRTPSRLAEGDLYRAFVKDEAAARTLHQGLTMLGDDGPLYGGVVMGPLDLMPIEPDVVVLYISPGQALRVIIAFGYKGGEAVRSVITGQASMCSAVALAVRDGKVTVDIPCMGDRAYGLVQDHELVVAFPASRLAELVEGLKATESVARYPFRPFLQWPAIFPPSFEPRPKELD